MNNDNVDCCEIVDVSEATNFSSGFVVGNVLSLMMIVLRLCENWITYPEQNFLLLTDLV
jgi:hypothetical protein